jgi:hypothetical protein
MLTHVDPREHARWYGELGRVVFPGGLVLVATQGRSTLARRSVSQNGSAVVTFAKKGWAYVGTGRRAAAIVSCDYTRRCLGDLFALEEYEEQGHGLLDTYLLRRRG